MDLAKALVYSLIYSLFTLMACRIDGGQTHCRIGSSRYV